MDETVNEQSLFEESDFATDQTESESSPAVEETIEQPTSEEQEVAEPVDSTTNANEEQTGDDMSEFLAKKGIKSDDPDALRKVTEMYRNVEKEFGKKSQEKAQLERQLAQNNTMQPVVDNSDAIARIQALEQRIATDQRVQAAKEWKTAKKLDPETEKRMCEYLEQPIVMNGVPQTDKFGNPLTKSFLLNSGAISFDDVYRFIGGDSIKADALKENLREAVAKEVAAKQIAKSPSALATNSTQFDKAEKPDPFVEGLFGD